MLQRRSISIMAGCLALMLSSMPVYGANTEEAQLQSSSETESSVSENKSVTTAAELKDLPREELIERIGELCKEDYQQSDILASVSTAQCILESGYLASDLAVEGNNCFGMKTTLSGNDWEGSTWDGTSTYTKQTREEYSGSVQTITASFRAYDSIEDSIGDHSAYLLGAKLDDGTRRYEGLEGETDYQKAVQVIRDGGYATSSSYVQQVCDIIETYDLTRFDEKDADTVSADKEKKNKNKKNTDKKVSQSVETASEDELYRVRKSWEDSSSQIGAFRDIANARNACRDGYHIYDSQGEEVE